MHKCDSNRNFIILRVLDEATLEVIGLDKFLEGSFYKLDLLRVLLVDVTPLVL